MRGETINEIEEISAVHTYSAGYVRVIERSACESVLRSEPVSNVCVLNEVMEQSHSKQTLFHH